MLVNDEWLLRQQLLPAIRSVSGDFFTFQQDSAPAHRARETVALLSAETPDFISPQDWPPNRPDRWTTRFWDSARTSLPLPDPWRRPSERTTDWRVASIWSEHYWQWTSGVIDCANVCVQKGDTLNIWFKQFGCSDWHRLCWKLLTCE